MTRHAFVLLAAATSALMTSAAFASPGLESRAVRVSWADLDLNRDAGVERLYARLQRAAESACGEVDGRQLRAFAERQVCVARALRHAVHAVHSERLTAHYLAAVAHTRPASFG